MISNSRGLITYVITDVQKKTQLVSSVEDAKHVSL